MIIVGAGHGIVFLLNVSFEVMLDEFDVSAVTNLPGFIGRKGINHDDFICNLRNGIQAASDMSLFIEGNDNR